MTRKLTSRGKILKSQEGIILFASDIELPRMLYAITIRSPSASGILKNIHTPKLPASYTLITADDIPKNNFLDSIKLPILAKDRVSYIGEPCAILCGPSLTELEEYRSAVEVIVEEEQPLFSLFSFNDNQIFAARNIVLENPCKVQKENDETQNENIIIEGTYQTGIQDNWYGETTGAVAVSLKKSFQIFTSTQWVSNVRNSVSSMLGIPNSQIAVKQCSVDFPFDGKIFYPSLISCHAALAAYITKKNIKLILKRDEDFKYSPKRPASLVKIKSIVNKSGQLISTDFKITLGLGAYSTFANEFLERICLSAASTYKLGTITINGSAIKTNIPPAGPMCGFGLSQGFFAIEQHVSKIASVLRENGAEWRKNHVLHSNKFINKDSVVTNNLNFKGIIDDVCRASDYNRKWASYELLRNLKNDSDIKIDPMRGIGIAVAYQGAGFIYPDSRNNSTVTVTMEKDSTLEIIIPTSFNNSAERIWKYTAAKILSIDEKLIRITKYMPEEDEENTEKKKYDAPIETLGIHYSLIANLIEKACVSISKSRFRMSLPISVEKSYRPLRKINWEGKVWDQNSFLHPSLCAAVVEVEIDPVELIANIKNVYLSVYAGKIFSPPEARSSLSLSAISALGWASSEKLNYIDGRIVQPCYTYGIPKPSTIPKIKINFIEEDEKIIASGLKELPFNSIPCAYLTAVNQAANYNFSAIPFNSYSLWEAQQKKEVSE